MIIKILSHKNPKFKYLINYINKENRKNPIFITQNIHTIENKEQIFEAFEENSKYLSKRKNGTYLYHTIISLPHQKDISKQEQELILHDLADKYLSLFGNKRLAYGLVHLNEEHLHCHLMISSNNKHSEQRIRFQPHQIFEIQKEVERYKEEKYPHLEDKTLYQEKSKERKSTKDKSYFQEKRKGKLERIEIIKQKAKQIILSSYSFDELEAEFKKQNFQLYTRGKTYGIIDLQDQDIKQRKYRISRLELQQEFENFLQFAKAREKEIEEIKKIQGRSREIEKER